MKTYKLILAHLLFFILMFFTTMLLQKHGHFKYALYTIFILGLSVVIFVQIYSAKKLLYCLLLNFLTLVFFYELLMFVEYSFGILSPKYTEVIIVGTVLTIIAITIYLGGIVLFSCLIKRIKGPIARLNVRRDS